MHFATHSELAGRHALLSASKYHWIRYSDEKMMTFLETSLLAAFGTRLHEFAKDAIELKQKLPRSEKTLNLFVNDAIGFKMTPELVLFYSINVFGTADAVSFNERTLVLRIHDLKTGVSKASFDQLLIYAAIFCLEYDYKPFELDIQLRIYQNDEVLEYDSETIVEEVTSIMDKIVHFDRLIEQKKEEALA